MRRGECTGREGLKARLHGTASASMSTETRTPNANLRLPPLTERTIMKAAIAEAHRVSEHGRMRGRQVLVVG